MDTSTLRPTLVSLSILACALAATAYAQEPPRGERKPAKPAPPDDKRAGPALVYKQGPAACLTESQFRDEVAIILDGADHLRTAAPDTAEVTFEKEPGGYRGTAVYTDAAGKKETIVKHFKNCSDLGRWVAGPVSGWVPPPPAAPALTCDPCAAAAQNKEEIAELRRKLEEQRHKLEEHERRDGRRNDEQDERIEALEARIPALQKALDEAKKNNRMDLSGWLTTGVLVTANLTSNVGPAVYIGGGARSGPISLGLEARVVLPAPVNVGTTKAGEKLDFDLSQVVGLLTPCGHFSYFFGCAVAGAGVQVAHDSNFSAGVKDNLVPLVHLGGRAGIEIPFGDSPFGIRGWGEVLYSTPSTYVAYHLSESIYQSTRPDVSAFFGIGLVVRVGGKGAN